MRRGRARRCIPEGPRGREGASAPRAKHGGRPRTGELEVQGASREPGDESDRAQRPREWHGAREHEQHAQGCARGEA